MFLQKLFLNLPIVIALVAFMLAPAIAADAAKSLQAVWQDQRDAISMSRQWDRPSSERAAVALEECVALAIELKEYDFAAQSLNEGAKLAQGFAEWDNAFALLNRALRIEADHKLVNEKAISLSLYSIIAFEKSDRMLGRTYSKRAASVAVSELSPLAIAYVAFSSGMNAYLHGSAKDANVFFSKAKDFSESTDDLELRNQILLFLGYSYHALGDPFEARIAILKAYEESDQQGYRRGKSMSARALGFIHNLFGEKQRALDRFKQSLTDFPEDFENVERGRVFLWIATIYEQLAQLDLAEENVQSAINCFERASDNRGILDATIHFGDISLARSDLDRANNFYGDAYRRAVKIGNSFVQAEILESLGNLRIKRGEYEDGIGDIRQAIQIYEAKGTNVADAYSLLGKALFEARRFAEAEFQIKRAIKMNEIVNDGVRLSENYYDLARLSKEMGLRDEALSYAGEAVRYLDRQYSDVARADFKGQFFSSVYDRFDLYISLLMANESGLDQSDHLSRALHSKERFSSRMILESIKLSGINYVKDAEPKILERQKEIRILLNLKKDELIGKLQSGTEVSDTSDLQVKIRDFQNQLEDIRVSLKQNSPLYATLNDIDSFEMSALQSKEFLSESTLLEYHLGKEESYLWLVSKDSLEAFYLPSRDVIESRVERLRGNLAGRGIRDGETVEDYQVRLVVAEREYWVEARALSEDLLGQVGDRIKGKRLIIVPDGKLQYFPFGGLPEPGVAENRPLVVDHEIVYEPSASVLKLIRQTGEMNKRPEPSKDVLVYADPVYSKTDGRLTHNDSPDGGFVSTILGHFRSVESIDKLQRLPATEDEAKSIADTVGSNRTTVRTGFAANRTNALAADVSDYKVLHFATHGLIDETRPELSGIVLSMFDREGKPQDGGFIRMQDVYGLNLNTDLVVLSACDTGLGKVIKGEGIMSLNNAFLQSGAKSVVSSLWKVDDTVTRELMSEFYRGIVSDGLTPAAALRHAQIKMFNDPRFSSPFYWAAFTAQGDYQRVPQIMGSRAARFSSPISVIFVGLVAFYLVLIGRRLAAGNI